VNRKHPSLLLALFLSLSLSACGARQSPPPARRPPAEGGTLYGRLGGREGVGAIVDAFLKRLLADPRVSAFFRGDKSLPKLEQQLCELSGGPCTYTGNDMRTAHSGMGISNLEFDAFIEDFKRALDEKGVSRRDESDLLAALAPMRTDVVEKKGAK
jgi:hemoglobin